jgi:hypothetical protein
MGRLKTLWLAAVLIASMGACQLLPLQDGETSPSAPTGSPEVTVPGGFSIPPARDLGSPDPPATVQPIAPP